MTLLFPLTFETTHTFFIYIDSKSEIGNPSHLDVNRKIPYFEANFNASLLFFHPVTSMLGDVNWDRSSPLPIQTNLVLGMLSAILLKTLGPFCVEILPIVNTTLLLFLFES